ncbi:MAG: hypothetical protein ACI4J6_08260 [Oscillospiraceae bacterium]
MVKRKIAALAAAALAASMLAACADTADTNAGTEQVSIETQTETQVETQTEAQSEEKTAESVTESETSVMEAETEAAAVIYSDVSEIGKMLENYGETDEEFYKGRFSEWVFDNSSIISSKDDFIDICGTELWDKAVETLMSDEYMSELYGEMQGAVLGEDGYFVYGAEDIPPLAYSNPYINEQGLPAAGFNCAAYEDFDGDGRKECFAVLTSVNFEASWNTYYNDYVVFIGSDGGAEVVTYGVSCTFSLIRYSGFVHAAFDFGNNISSSHGEIFAVESGKAVCKHYSFHVGSKQGLALEESMAQAPGAWLIIWDNVLKEYVGIDGVKAGGALTELIYGSEAFTKLNSEDGRKTIDSSEELEKTLTVTGGRLLSFCPGGFFPSGMIYEGGKLVPSDGGIIDYEFCERGEAVNLILAEKYADRLSEDVYASQPENVKAVTEFKAVGNSENIPEDIIKAAEDCLMSSKDYRMTEIQAENGYVSDGQYRIKWSVTGRTVTYRPEENYFNGGKPNIIFDKAYKLDLDGDGADEYIIAEILPKFEMYQYESDGVKTSRVTPVTYTVYVNSDGAASLLRSDEGETSIQLVEFEDGEVMININIVFPYEHAAAYAADENGMHLLHGEYSMSKITGTADGVYFVTKYREFCYRSKESGNIVFLEENYVVPDELSDSLLCSSKFLGSEPGRLYADEGIEPSLWTVADKYIAASIYHDSERYFAFFEYSGTDIMPANFVPAE